MTSSQSNVIGEIPFMWSKMTS